MYLESAGGEMSNTIGKNDRLHPDANEINEHFKVWWKNEGERISQHLPVEALVFTAWSNGAYVAYVALSDKLKLENV
jgi:hypothetical protein